MQDFYKAKFCIEPLDKQFEGYTDGATWNGFACPFFEYDEAISILTELDNEWTFEPLEERFVVRRKDDPEDYASEYFERVRITMGSLELDTYPIGAYSWIWGECNDEILGR